MLSLSLSLPFASSTTSDRCVCTQQSGDLCAIIGDCAVAAAAAAAATASLPLPVGGGKDSLKVLYW